MTYIVENNGVYGLTKGQFSATADRGSKSKRGATNTDEGIDLAMLALQLGATYVGRGFSGDKEQLVPLIRGALSHPGPSFLDIISPCVAFNNHEGSTRSFDYVREHNEAVNQLDVITVHKAIEARYAPGSVQEIRQHDGSVLHLRKLEESYDASSRIRAISFIAGHQAKGEIVTGLLYVEGDTGDLHEALATVDTPLNQLGERELCPGRSALEKFNQGLR
jgi:2-oxoglutarate ferredoxin oxidoreductase subunit beta